MTFSTKSKNIPFLEFPLIVNVRSKREQDYYNTNSPFSEYPIAPPPSPISLYKEETKEMSDIVPQEVLKDITWTVDIVPQEVLKKITWQVDLISQKVLDNMYYTFPIVSVG
jgi:hypothetical protein